MTRSSLFTGLIFAAAIGTGIAAGIFFAFSSFVMAALERIAPAQAVAAMNSMSVTVINPYFMSVFAGTALLCLIIGVRSLLVMSQGAARLALVASLVYLVGTFGVTAVFNVPLNQKLAIEGITFWREYLAAWCWWNHVRTVAAAISATLFMWALCRS